MTVAQPVQSTGKTGIALLTSKHENEGTAYTAEARTRLGLRGLVPPAIESLDQQVARVLARLDGVDSNIEKYTYLARLRSEGTVLFYNALCKNLTRICPLIYTPVVGEACQKFSHIYTPGLFEGLFLSKADVDIIPDVLDNWPYPSPDICVITDGSRILGLGDLGVNGHGIPVGKLSLYIAAAGFDPKKTLPITVDMGTARKELREDPLYFGLRSERPQEDEFYAIMDAVMAGLKAKWPKMLVQFEDFSTDHAFDTLTRYRKSHLMFNDDISGTGAVVAAGFINAVRLSGIELAKHRIVFFGAGSAGVGVSMQLRDHMMKSGISEKDARDAFWLVDSKGLVTEDRGDKLGNHKLLFSRSDNDGKQFKSLAEVLDYVKPTCLIGLAGQGGTFTEDIIKQMAGLTDRPIIFPLSNPLTSAECTFEDAMKFTDGKVLFASGTAFPPYKDPKSGKDKEAAQGNNMYIFPGLGFGSVLAGSEQVTDAMIHQSAVTLSNSMTEAETDDDRLYPRLERIREVSALIARDVALVALEEGIAHDSEVLKIFDVKKGAPSKSALADEAKKTALLELTKGRMWDPEYPKKA
ncbi:hypothetical protein HKX48_005164 [Thoreauomyces humboldtii]|nr:hypothetical protein HKX48_005164 [Thoreauomyces humboldtii]